jgi:P27 family predicted phage terminase small subunit
MMGGRKPKPTRLHRLHGTRPHTSRAAEPTPAVPADPPVPSELADTPPAIAEWLRLAPILYKLKIATEADRSALVALCLEWARYLDASAQVKLRGLVVKAPSGYPIMNPYLPIATKALGNCNRLWPELGLTPSSRARVAVTTGPNDDAFAEFDGVPDWSKPGKPN